MKEYTFRPNLQPIERVIPQKNVLEGSMRAVEQFISRMAKAKQSAIEKKLAETNPKLLKKSKSPAKRIGYITTGTPSPRSHAFKENVPDNFKPLSTCPSVH